MLLPEEFDDTDLRAVEARHPRTLDTAQVHRPGLPAQ